MMEDEIDLRAYIEVLLRHWKWILGLALVAAVAAFGVSLLLPRTYEASAVVLVTSPRYQIQFDPRFGTEEQTPVYKALPSLAMSDGILQSVVEGYAPSDKSGIKSWTLTALRGMAEATSEGDPSLVLLKVTSRSPRDAAAIANMWAETLVRRGNEIYGQSATDVGFFQTQVSEAEGALQQAEAALVEFQARNQASIISAQLDSLLQAQTDYLADQRMISYIVRDIEGLHGQLAEQPGDQSVSLADGLTALLLQIKAFNAQASTPVQIQVDGGAGLSDKSLSEQIVFLNDLVATLQAKSTEIDNQLTDLEPRILALQKTLQQTTVENDRLTRARDLARETYVTLTRKLDEARIAAQQENGLSQIGSQAAIPEEPAGPRKMLNTAIAGALGLMVGVFGAFFFEFWQRNGSKEAKTGNQAGA
jgi:succinoglycan biosynthesis transport protein ExoP